MWNVIIVEVRHEQQILPSASIERCGAHNIDAIDVEFVVAVSMRHDNDYY
jgi:hypothetical protein